jgi:hypothetical protein
MKVQETLSMWSMVEHAQKVTMAIAMAITTALLASQFAPSIGMTAENDVAQAKEKLANDVMVWIKVLHPAMKESGFDHLGGASAAVHQ